MDTMKTLQRMHFEHTLWQNLLEFAQNELPILEQFLENSDRSFLEKDKVEILSKLHHFERLADKLMKSLMAHKGDLATEVQTDQIKDATLRNDHSYLRDEMFLFEQNYAAFKREFKDFISEAVS